jgi:chromosome segregation ATPase
MSNGYEEPNYESPKERELNIRKEKIAEVFEIIEKIKALSAQHKEKDKEEQEVTIIIDGLNKKIDLLITEDRAEFTNIPDSDEKWAQYVSLREKINSLRDRVMSLYNERDEIHKEMGEMSDSINALIEQAESLLEEING